MRTVYGNAPSVGRAIESEDELTSFDGDLKEDVSGGIVCESKIRFGNIYGGIHAIGFVVTDGVGVVVPLGYFLPGIECGTEERC